MTSESVASELLRPGLLEGVSVLLATTAMGDDVASPFAVAVRHACGALGATVQLCPTPAFDPSKDAETALDDALAPALSAGRIDVAVVDAASVRADVGGFPASLEAAWNVTRAVANNAFIPSARGGRIIYIAPPQGADIHAQAARAALENLARTLSVEWARHAVTVVAIAPGTGTTASEVAALCTYLASPAGAYFSGCRLELGAVA